MKEIKGSKDSLRKDSFSDRLVDCAVLFLLCLGICMPVSLMVLGAIWVLGLAFNHPVPFTFANYYILDFFFALVIWVMWMVDTKGKVK